MIFVSSLEFQVGSCLYVTAAVEAASHFGRAQGDHSGQGQFLGSLEPVGHLGAHTSYTLQRGRSS